MQPEGQRILFWSGNYVRSSGLPSSQCVREAPVTALLIQGEWMAFVLSTRSVSQSRFRMLTTRQILALTGTTCSVLASAAFCAGWYFGQASRAMDSTTSVDPVQQRFTIDRIGELAGRLVTLEMDARTLVKKLSALEMLDSRLSELRKGKGVKPQPRQGGLGGQAFAPQQPCLGDIDPASVARDPHGTESTLSCLRNLIEKVSTVASNRGVSYMSMPIREPVQNSIMGSGFGNRIDPFNGSIAFHSGLDFQAPIGRPIHAAGGGRVKVAGWGKDLGFVVEIDHGNGLTSRYAHTSKIYVKEGDLVVPRQVIAAVGTTGRSTGPHLHFEILHDGRFLDPSSFLEAGRLMPNA